MPEYIWNGVGLTVPDGWEPSALERDGLMLERDGIPTCELKWRTVEGEFSFEKHLKKLTKQHKGVDMQAVEASETPASWQESLASLTQSGIQAHSFIWRTSTHKGIGASLHNKATGLAALVQFFIVFDGDDALAAEVLASFRDYSGGKTIPWAMFGMHARIPADYVLNTFSFKPGHYTVEYWRPKSGKKKGKIPAGKGPGTALVFERIVPASVVLKQISLNEWVRDGFENGPSESLEVAASDNVVSWAGVVKSSVLRKALRREQVSAGKAWLPESGNAILAVTASGVVPMTKETFTTICDSYELV